MKDTALIIAAIIFLLASTMHLLRLILRAHVRVNNFVVPMGLSVFGFIVPLCLALWFLHLLFGPK